MRTLKLSSTPSMLSTRRRNDNRVAQTQLFGPLPVRHRPRASPAFTPHEPAAMLSTMPGSADSCSWRSHKTARASCWSKLSITNRYRLAQSCGCAWSLRTTARARIVHDAGWQLALEPPSISRDLRESDHWPPVLTDTSQQTYNHVILGHRVVMASLWAGRAPGEWTAPGPGAQLQLQSSRPLDYPLSCSCHGFKTFRSVDLLQHRIAVACALVVLHACVPRHSCDLRLTAFTGWIREQEFWRVCTPPWRSPVSMLQLSFIALRPIDICAQLLLMISGRARSVRVRMMRLPSFDAQPHAQRAEHDNHTTVITIEVAPALLQPTTM